MGKGGITEPGSQPAVDCHKPAVNLRLTVTSRHPNKVGCHVTAVNTVDCHVNNVPYTNMASKRENLRKLMMQTSASTVGYTPVDDLAIIKDIETETNNQSKLQDKTTKAAVIAPVTNDEKEVFDVENNLKDKTYTIPKAVSFSIENAMYIRQTSIRQHISISQFIVNIFEKEMSNYRNHKEIITPDVVRSLIEKNNSYGKNAKRLSFFLSQELVDFFYEYQMDVGLKLTTIYNYLVDKARMNK